MYATTYIVWDKKGLLGFKQSPSDRGMDVLLELMRNKFEVKTEEG
jgi:hypothetical protein